MTLLTDLLLALVTFYLAYNFEKESAVQFKHYSTSYTLFALAAIAGGAHHGFAEIYSETILYIIWKITLFSCGLATYFLLSGVIQNFPNSALTGLISNLTLLKVVTYSVLATMIDDFNLVAVDVSISLLLIIFILSTQHREKPDLQWFYVAIVILLFIAIIWFSEFSLYGQFNHNVISNILQTIVIYSIYGSFSNL
jgi:hypothetical protein